MYHAIVAHQVRKVFAALNRGDYEPILTGLAPRFEHWFSGTSALAGLRSSLPVTRAWYERLVRIFPDIRFDLRSISVSGPPWNTRVAVEWTDSYTLRDGRSHHNIGMHLIRMRWSKVASVRIHCDTRLLEQNLAIQAQHGVPDANACALEG